MSDALTTATATVERRSLAATARAVVINAPLLIYELYNWLLRALLPRTTYFPPDTLPDTLTLAAHWREVREELDAVLERDAVRPTVTIDPGQARIAGEADWKLFVFRAFGIDAVENQQHCPVTWSHLSQIHGLVTAMFSVLEPGTSLAPHTGLLKGVLRVHLGLTVPPSDVWFELDGERRTWAEGELLVFDECFRHTAVNHSDQRRVVLLLDVLRPMPWPWLDRLNTWVVGTVARSKRFQAGVDRSIVRY